MPRRWIVDVVCGNPAWREPEGRTAAGLLFTASVLLSMITAGSNFVTALQGTLIAVDDSVYKCGSGTPEKGTVAVACYAGIHYRIWAECSGTGQFRAGRSYVGWGYSPLESIGRSFLEGVKHLPEFTGSIVLMVMVMLLPPDSGRHLRRRSIVSGIRESYFCGPSACMPPVTPQSLYSPRTCRIVQNSECGEDHIIIAVVPERKYTGVAGCSKDCRRRHQAARQDGWRTGTEAAVWWFYAIMGLEFIMIFQVVTQSGRTLFGLWGLLLCAYRRKRIISHQEYLERWRSYWR